MSHQPGRPGGDSSDQPAEGAPSADPAEPGTDAPHLEEPAEGDRAPSAQDAP